MKRRFFNVLCLALALAACKKDSHSATTAKQSSPVKHAYGREFTDSASSGSSQFIAPAIANRMINSYLYSINSPLNDSDIRSFSVNADSLRAYLSNPAVKNVKLMFAHTMSYIDAGYEGQYAGYQSGAMTIVLAGYDSVGNYTYYNGYVLDHLTPCPYSCPPGLASSYLLQ